MGLIFYADINNSEMDQLGQLNINSVPVDILPDLIGKYKNLTITYMYQLGFEIFYNLGWKIQKRAKHFPFCVTDPSRL